MSLNGEVSVAQTAVCIVAVGCGACRGDACVAPPAAASMSRLMTRPSGPEPVRFARSTPLSAAMRLARGEARRRPAGGDATGAGVAVGVAGAGTAVTGWGAAGGDEVG